MTRRLLVDASVWLSLAEVGAVGLLRELDGRIVVPEAVGDEITGEPAASLLEQAVEDDWVQRTVAADGTGEARLQRAATVLGESREGDLIGDIALLALAFESGGVERVVVSDDKPLRRACRAHSVQVSGSLGVLVVAVEAGALDPEEAVETLTAMDSAGARFNASLLRRAERLIEDAADES